MNGKFTLEIFEHVSNPFIKFFIVSVNGKSLFVDFVNKLKQKDDMDGLYSIISSMDNFGKKNIIFTEKKFRHINKSNKGLRKDIYEFKGNNIRVYGIKSDSVFYILSAGWKKNQDKDIAKVFRLFNGFPEF